MINSNQNLVSEAGAVVYSFILVYPNEHHEIDIISATSTFFLLVYLVINLVF